MADAGEIKAKVTITYDGSGVKEAKKDLEELAQLGGTVEAGAQQASNGLGGLEENANKAAASTENLNTALEKTSKPVETLTTAVSEVNDQLSQTQTIAQDTGQAFQEIHEPIQKATTLLGNASAAVPQLTTQASSLHEALQTAGGGFAQVQSVIEETLPQLQPYVQHMQQLRQLASTFANTPLLPAPAPEAIQALEEMPNVVEGTIQAIDEAVQAAPTWRDQFGFGSDFQLQFDKSGRIIGAGADQIENYFAQMDAAAANSGASMGNFTQVAQEAGQTISENVTPSLHEAGKATENFNAQFSGLNDAVVETNKSMKETGAIAEDLAGGSTSSGAKGKAPIPYMQQDVLSRPLMFLNDLMMPFMAAQMVGGAISAIGQNIYDAAAIAEGPGAHGLGTFTGAVDTFRQSTEKANQSFSEGFGQGVLPALEGMNNANANGSGGIDWGSFGYGLGVETGVVGDILGLAGGGILSGLAKIVTLNPGNTFGDNIWQGSLQGLANTWAGLTGQELPYPGPAPVSQVQLAYQQQMAAMPVQLAVQTATLNAQANDPEFLAAQAGYQSAYGKAVKAQQAWDVSHYAGSTGPTDWINDVLQYQAVTAAGGTYGNLTDPNAIFFGWNDYINGKNGPYTCFPAGSRVLMADGTEKPIEQIQIGDRVLAHDGEKRVRTTVLSLIRPRRPKLVCELQLSDGTFLQTTDSHPISTVDGWKSLNPEGTKQENPDLPVSLLQVGDIVHTLAGSTMLLAVTPLEEMTIYNLSVDEPHTFYVEKVLVHNKPSGGSYGGLNYSSGGYGGGGYGGGGYGGGGGGGIDWGGIGDSIGGFFGGIGKSISDFWNQPNGGADTLGMLFDPKSWGFGGDQSASTFTGGCFPAGTPVMLINGKTKPIEMLEIGDYVLAHDGKKKVATYVLARIIPPPKPVYELALSDGTLLKLTDSHPISTLAGWKSISPQATALENPDLEVSPLEIGDTIHTVNGTCVLVDMYRLPGVVQVYNIEVAEPHTFYAGGVLVHNKPMSAAIQQNVAESQVPTMDFKNTPLMSSIVGNFSSMDLNHTFTATATWVGNGLQNTFNGVASWIGQGLANTFNGVASWVGQGLANTFSGVASWVGQGLSNTFQGVASWFGQNLSNTFQGVANWFGTGLQNTFQGMASWVGSNLSNTFNGVASWMGDGLSHLFKGEASWEGKDLNHTFIASPTWIGQNLNPTFTASPNWLPGFASGVTNFAGGYAVVGERGPELVYLPQGSNVVPNHELDGFMGGGGGGGFGGGPIVINITHVTQLDGRVIMKESAPYLATAARQLVGGKR